MNRKKSYSDKMNNVKYQFKIRKYTKVNNKIR